ncbi:pyruvate decarboxylase [Exidia glandulosa HHB12029]|uniref:Pyruvate decarboxylase n=1 Tax=Exidia glandulosa HHB12029 TaxID=1314781 RepID=A0A165IF29_EXIGL|nr:pyruvate decarboxylase [Exidia glandulosa HHB12029]
MSPPTALRSRHRLALGRGEPADLPIVQLGVKSIFGVPGDFNLAFLDQIDDHKDIEWVGCCNELNAAYAADGYARVSKGLGVLVTTFGVGELSALNGVAGAFSERVPVLHLVGVPSTVHQAHHAILHHTLGDGRFNVYLECGAHVTIGQEMLMTADRASAQIDKMLITALTTCRPTYLTLPTDLVFAKVSTAPLSRALTPSRIREALFTLPPPHSELAQLHDSAVSAVTKLCASAERPLIEHTGMTFFTTPMAKSVLDEDHELFGGVYIGNATIEPVKNAFEKADLVITVGLLMSDFNSGNFSFRLPAERTIELHSDMTKVGTEQYAGVTFFTMLPALIDALPPKHELAVTETPKDKVKAGIFASPPEGAPKDVITQDWFWPVFTRGVLKEGDILLGETGTSMFGLMDVHVPRRTMCLSQVLWGSIGWSVGATLGAAVAAKERGRRMVCFTGDGSVQVTVNDFSTMLRLGLKPVIVLLNNDGYTIERFINGPERHYNDIQPWKWATLLSTFGATPEQAAIHRIATPGELEALLKRDDFGDGSKMEFVEVILGKMDAPRLLKVQAELTHKFNLQ